MKGFWYEIARQQTAGGAIFQTGSVCTGLDFTPFGDGARKHYYYFLVDHENKIIKF